MNAATPLRISEDMTIYQAAAQKPLLLDALGIGEHLELDLSGVAEMDSAGLQILLLLKREALKAGKQLSISGHSPAVRQILDLCNLVGVFGDPMIIPANA